MEEQVELLLHLLRCLLCCLLLLRLLLLQLLDLLLQLVFPPELLLLLCLHADRCRLRCGCFGCFALLVLERCTPALVCRPVLELLVAFGCLGCCCLLNCLELLLVMRLRLGELLLE